MSPRPFLLLTLVACAQAETTPPPQAPAPAAAPSHAPTALDLMVAHATELALRPEQLEKVKALARELDATNAPLEQSLTKLESAKAETDTPTDSPPPPRARGGGGGGRGGAFRGGGRGGMGAGGGRGRRPAATSTTTPRPHSDQAQSVHAQMADNHATAVARAFSVLDQAQQEKASQLLDANDFEPPSVESVQQATESAAPKHAVTSP